MDTTTETPTLTAADAEQLSTLAETFPALRGAPGVRPFDPELLAAALDGAPTGEHALEIAGAFLLWLCPHRGSEDQDPGGRRFNLLDAAILLDAEHRAALAAWVREPWIPAARKLERGIALDAEADAADVASFELELGAVSAKRGLA